MVFRIFIQIISYLLNGYPDSKLSVLSTPIEDYCGLWKPENAKLRNICNRSESGINGKLPLHYSDTYRLLPQPLCRHQHNSIT